MKLTTLVRVSILATVAIIAVASIALAFFYRDLEQAITLNARMKSVQSGVSFLSQLSADFALYPNERIHGQLRVSHEKLIADIDGLISSRPEAMEFRNRLVYLATSQAAIFQRLEKIAETGGAGDGRLRSQASELWVGVLIANLQKVSAAVRQLDRLSLLWIKTSFRNTLLVALGIVVAVFGALVGFWALVATRIVAPCLMMRKAVLAIGQGNLDLKIEPSGPAELQEIAIAVNEMARNTARHLEAVTASRDKLDKETGRRRAIMRDLGRLNEILEKEVANRIAAENDAKEQGGRLAAILESAIDPILSIDERGTILTANAATERVFGYSSEELIGNSFSMLMTYPESVSHNGFLQLFGETEETRVNSIGREVVGRRKDGSEMDLELAVSRADYAGRRTYTGVLRDISARKREERLKQLHQEELEALNADLTRSNSELEQFAYVASHDLQEPLRMVASYTELMSSRYGEDLDSRGLKYLSYASGGARRMQSLIESLLSYSRVGTQGRPLVPENGAEILQQALDNLQITIAETGTKIVVGALPTVLADREQLFQVFQNLIGNAIKFRHDDRNAVISIEAEKKDGMWQFAVRDNGIGIAEEHLGRIFTIFQRLHERDSYPGDGFGLTIVKKIVERHGGRIWVESQPGIGSCFFFTLQAASAGEDLNATASQLMEDDYETHRGSAGGANPGS